MNELGFPPLPRDTRLRVEAAELAPTPRLELTADPLVPGGPGRVYAAVIGFAVLSVAVGVPTVASMAGFGAIELLEGMACSLILPAIGAGVACEQFLKTTRLGLRATPDRLETDRVWAARSRAFSHDVTAESPPIRDPATISDRAGALRLADDRPFTPFLRQADREWVRHALARVYAAAGAPGFAATVPLCVSVTPRGDRENRHPRFRTLRDDPDRLELFFHRRPTRAARLGYAAITLAAGAALALVVWVTSGAAWPIPEHDRVLVLSLMAVALLLGLCSAAPAWQSVRITVRSDHVWIGRGVGPVRRETAVPTARLAAVVLGAGREPDPDAKGAERRRPVAWLLESGAADVPPSGKLADPWHRLLPLENDDEAFAAALAQRLADRLARFGWSPTPPVDWRFGWRDPAPPPERP